MFMTIVYGSYVVPMPGHPTRLPFCNGAKVHETLAEAAKETCDFEGGEEIAYYQWDGKQTMPLTKDQERFLDTIFGGKSDHG